MIFTNFFHGGGDGSGEGVPMCPGKGASRLYVIQDPKLAGSCPQYTYVCFIIFEIAIAILNSINRLGPVMTQYHQCAVEAEFQIKFAMYSTLNWHSVVVIGTGLPAGPSNPGTCKIFFSSKISRPHLGPTQPLTEWASGVLFRG